MLGKMRATIFVEIIKRFQPFIMPNEGLNKWFLSKGAEMDGEVNLKCFLNWYHILRSERATWLTVKPERLVKGFELRRACREELVQDCL